MFVPSMSIDSNCQVNSGWSSNNGASVGGIEVTGCAVGSVVSGGEAQRIKLATELSKRDTGNTFYILDEPTTGLDSTTALQVIQMLSELAKKGKTIISTIHQPSS